MKTSYEICNKPAGRIGWTDDLGVQHWSYFAVTTDEWALSQGLTHEVAFDVAQVRFAVVLKTVLRVATDEDENGKVVLTSWKVKTTFFN